MKRQTSGFGNPAWLLVFYNNMFFGCAGFSIVLPTIWPYLREMDATPTFLACVVAMYSVGEGLGGIVCGRLYSRYPGSVKVVLLGNMFLGFLASLAYALAPAFGHSGALLVIVAARFFSGYDNGSRQTIEQTFIGTIVPARDQTTVSSRLASFAISGIMLGPAFGAPLQAVHFDVPALGITVDGNNGPGLVLAFVCFANMLVTALHFHPDRLQGESASAANAKAAPAKAEHLVCPIAPPPSSVGLYTCYAVFLLVNLSMASLETITPIVAQRLFGWGPCLHPAECTFEIEQTYVNLLLTCGGLLSLVMCLIMALFLGKVLFGREIVGMTLGLLVYTATNLSNVDFGGSLPAGRFVAGYLVGAFFGGLMRGPCISLLSQIIGPHQKAPYMGTLFAWGALPRVVGPFAFVKLLEIPPPLADADFPGVYHGPLPRTWLLYGSQAALFAAMALALALSRGPIRAHLAALRRASELTTPLLPGRAAHSAESICSEGMPLPASPMGMREGISDFGRVLSGKRAETLV